MGLVISAFSSFLKFVTGAKDDQKGSKFQIRDGITFFDYLPSPCARRVRMTLIEKNAVKKVRKVEVDLLKNEHGDPEFVKVNPNRKVPALAIRNVPGLSDCTLFESNVITEYLDAVLPGVNTYPKDPWERVQAKMWQDWELSLADNFWPVMYCNLLGFILRATKSREGYIRSFSLHLSPFQRDRNIRTYDGTLRTPEELEKHILACYKYLCTMERALEGKNYLVGDRFTTADLSICPRIMMYDTACLPIREIDFPNTYRYLQRIGNKPCFTKTSSSVPNFVQPLLSMLFGIVVVIGNWRSGESFKRYDGSKLIARAKQEAADEQKLQIGKSVPTAGANDLLVFYYAAAAECWQMKLMLSEKGVSFRTASCDMLELIGRTGGAEGVIRIQHGDHMVSGSRGLMDYLDASFGDEKLIPSDPLGRASVQCWQGWEQNVAAYDMSKFIDVMLVPRILHDRFPKDNCDELLDLRSNPKYTQNFSNIMRAYMSGVTPGSELWNKLAPQYGHLVDNLDATRIRDHCTLAMHDRLAYLDNSLMGNTYLVGPNLTLADICVFCRLLYLKPLGIKISEQQYPNVCGWWTTLKTRPHFRAIADEAESMF